MSAKYFSSKNGNVVLAMGNFKLHKSIAIWNLPAGYQYTCISDCPGCYAKKAQNRYPTVLSRRIRNFESSRLDSFVSDFLEALDRSKAKICRFHESGDIYSQEYSDKLAEIAALRSDVAFFAYTHTDFRPAGVNVVKSILPNGDLNYGPLEWVKVMSKRFSIPVCPVTLKVSVAKCGTTCKMCLSKPAMLFVKH
jgi:hypothetical protein